MRLASRIRKTKMDVKELADLLIVKGFVEAGEFLQRHISHLTTASELPPAGLKVPFTTNGMERLMQEIGKRTKKKGMYWSEVRRRAAENIIYGAKEVYASKKQKNLYRCLC